MKIQKEIVEQAVAVLKELDYEHTYHYKPKVFILNGIMYDENGRIVEEKE